MSVVRLHTKEFAHDVIDLLIAHWWLAPNVQNACIAVLSSMAAALGAEFRPYLTRLIPVILRTLHHETNETNLIAVSMTSVLSHSHPHNFCTSVGVKNTGKYSPCLFTHVWCKSSFNLRCVTSILIIESGLCQI